MLTVWVTPSVASTVAQTSAWEEVRTELKGTVPRDFSLHVLFMNHLPQAPDITNSVVTNFFEIYSQLKMANGKSEKVLNFFRPF
jgi:hypothetical protein